MPTIRKIQSRDVQFLSEAFTEYDETYFEQLYLDSLQNERTSFVAFQKYKDSDPQYLGYISLHWTSDDTNLWRHNIPQIMDFIVRDSHIDYALVHACELEAKEKSHIKICILSPASEQETASARYEQLGFTIETFSRPNKDNNIYWVKTID